MNFQSKRRSKRALVTMDITSLVDVVFLLLIFLLVTTTFRKDEYAFDIELPTSSAEQITITTDRTTVFIDSQGDLHLLVVPADSTSSSDEISDAKKVSVEELKGTLERIYTRRPDASIAIRGERRTSYQKITEVVGYIQEAGFRAISFPYEFDVKR